MIRIVRDGEAPASLVRWGGNQRQRDCDAFDKCPDNYKGGKRFESKQYYSSPNVKKRLLEIHHGKCCYCERRLPSAELQVEHFRPKQGVRQTLSQTVDDHPGYYWLAYEWTNLLLACATCNGATNKSTRFPLANPTKRASSHHSELSKERPLFIDPSVQNPRRHIWFQDEVPIGRTQAGSLTILGIGLGGSFLLDARREKLREIDAWLCVIDVAADYPNDAELQAKSTEFRERIEAAKRPEAAFSSMATDYLSSREW